ncbi:MAG: hypothetical protein JXB17_08975 [Bacteroidales bacterium]|nr:hypothetical protein [Bacteroidales bacterium]
MRISIFSFLLLIFSEILFAQENEPDNRPVRSPWETSLLIDNQTPLSPYKKGLDFNIHHRFSTVEDGITNLYGIYGASNIRLGLDYGITDRLMIGIGTEKDTKQQDIQWKYSILQQTRSGSIPVAISYFGNIAFDLRDSSFFGDANRYRHIHRISYFTQIILARKMTEKLSLQIAPCFIYFNAVNPGVGNAHAGISAGGRYKITSGISVIAEYDQLLTKNKSMDVKPNIAAGVEFATATHSFRLFLSSYKEITYQRNLVYNTNDFFKGEFLAGFNILVRFSL